MQVERTIEARPNSRMSRRFLSALLAVVSTVYFAYPTADPPGSRIATSEAWVRTELYFGTARPGGEVTESEFMEFVNSYVTPRFPDGLTLLTGYGQLLGSKGDIIKERSKVLILLYPPGFRAAHRRIEEIRKKYKEVFGQVSVLRVDSQSAVSF